MRSRFSAYALGDSAYLLVTWHPDTRPDQLELDNALRWRRLQIVDTLGGGVDDAEGVVEFRARYRHADQSNLLHERSRFVRSDTRWVYVDGDVMPLPATKH